MPRLPGFESLGGVQADSTRPVGSYDVSPFARGAQALAQGAENLGRGVSQVGNDIAEVQRQHNDALAIDAHSNFGMGLASLHTQLQTDKNFTTLEPRFNEEAKSLQNQYAQTIPDGYLRQHFIARSGEQIAHVAGAINRQAYNGMVSSDDDTLKLKTQSVLDDISVNPGNPARGAQVDALALHIDNAVSRGWKTPEEAQLLKRTVGIEVRKAEIMPRDYQSAVEFEQNFGRTAGKSTIPGLSQNADAWATSNQSALHASGVPVAITSAYRDPAHNAAVGGARSSQHMAGNAIDVSLTGLTPEQQQATVTQFLADPRTGGFGYYPNSNSIHVDVRGGGKAAWGADYHGASVGQGWPDWLTSTVQAWQGSPRGSSSAQSPQAAQAAPGPPERQGVDPIVASIDPAWLYRMSEHAKTIIQLNENTSARAIKSQSDAAANEWMVKLSQGHYDVNGILADQRMTPERRETLSKFVAHASGQPDDAIALGPGWVAAKQAVLSNPGDEGHISDPVEIARRGLPGGDLTPAGAKDIINTMKEVKNSDTQHALEAAKHGLMTYAKSVLSWDGETMVPGMRPLVHPEGVLAYDGTFVPVFNRAYAAWVNAGKDPMEFLKRDTVDKFADAIYPPARRKMDKLSAEVGSGMAPKDEQVPPVPQGVDPKGWTTLMQRPPLTAGGKPWPMENWAKTVQILLDRPEAQEEFDQRFGSAGLNSADVLGKLKPQPAAAPAAAAPPLDHGAHAEWRDDETGRTRTTEERVETLRMQEAENQRARIEGRAPRDIPFETPEQIAARETRQSAEAEETARAMAKGFGAITGAEPEVRKRMLQNDRQKTEQELEELAKNEKEAKESATGITRLQQIGIDNRRASLKRRLAGLEKEMQ